MKEFFLFPFCPPPLLGPLRGPGHYSTVQRRTIKSPRKNAAEESLGGRRQHTRPSGVRKKRGSGGAAGSRRSSRKQEEQRREEEEQRREPPGEASRSRSFFISHFPTLRLTFFFASFKHGRLPLAKQKCMCASLRFALPLYAKYIEGGKKNRN